MAPQHYPDGTVCELAGSHLILVVVGKLGGLPMGGGAVNLFSDPEGGVGQIFVINCIKRRKKQWNMYIYI